MDVCSSTQDEASVQQPSAPTMPVSSVPSLLTFPPHIAPVPAPVPPPALPMNRPQPPGGGPGPQLAPVPRPPLGVPPPAGMPPPFGAVGGPPAPPSSVGGPSPPGIHPPAGSFGVLPPTRNAGGAPQPFRSVGGPLPPPGSVGGFPPAGNVGVPPIGSGGPLPLPGIVGGPSPSGVLPLTGSVGVPPPPPGSVGGLPLVGSVGGPLPLGSGGPPPVSVGDRLPPPGSVGIPQPAGNVGGSVPPDSVGGPHAGSGGGGPLPPGSIGVFPTAGTVGGPPLPSRSVGPLPPPGSVSVLPPGRSISGLPPTGSVSPLLPSGSVGGPLPPGSTGVFPAERSVGVPLPPPGSVGGPLPPGNVGILQTAGNIGGPHPVGVPQPSGVPPVPTNSLPLSAAGSHPAAVPLPANVMRPVGILRPMSVPAPASVSSSLPMPRFMARFDPSVPPPAVSEMPAVPTSRATEDMDLDNSTSSDDDLGEGFDEEWPICSRRTSSKSRGSREYDPFEHDQSLLLSQSQPSGSGVRSAEPSSLQEKLPVQSIGAFRMASDQPNTNQMLGTSMPVSGSNFASLSGSLDRINQPPLSSAPASMPFAGGTTLVRSLPSMQHAGSVPSGMPRAPGTANPISGSAYRGPSDVDLRISSVGPGLVPVGLPPERMVPPPLPPLPRPPVPVQQPPGPVRPFIESSLAGPSDKYPAVVSSSVAGMGPVQGPLGLRLGDAVHPGPVGMPGNVLPGVSNIPGPMPPVSGAINAPGMVQGMIHGPDDVPVRPGLVYPVPSSTFEPASVRPPSQQGLMQGGMNTNPVMMPAASGLVRGQAPGGGQPLGSGRGNVEHFAGGGMQPVNMGNIGSLRGPAEFGGVRNVVPLDQVRFNLQPDMPRTRAALPGSLPPGLDDTVGRMPQIAPPLWGPPSMQNAPARFAGMSVDQNAALLGSSERVLNTLQSLAGMQTAPLKDHPSHGNSSIHTVDTGMQQVAPGMNRSSFGLSAEVTTGFGSPPVRSLLDGIGPGLPRAGLPPPPRLGTGLPRFPLPGNIHSFMWNKY